MFKLIKKALLIYRVDMSNVANHGIRQKMYGQQTGLKSLGVAQVDTLYLAENNVMYNDEIAFTFNNAQSLKSKWQWYNKALDIVADQSYDLIILRYGIATPAMIKFCSTYKSNFPHCSIVIEMPTYPYEQEWQGIKGYFALKLDKWYRQQLQAHVDYVLHSGPETQIFGIPTLPFSNGIDSHAAPLRTITQNQTVHIIAVAKWQHWHGLDRFFDAYAHYDGDIPIFFHMVGNGPALGYYRKYRKRLGLYQKMIIYGNIKGEALNALYDKCHVALGTLGMHRKGVSKDSSLKHRAYCLRGIPFILAAPDDDFPEHLPWVRYVAQNNSPLPLEELIKWAQRVGNDPAIAQEMHHYATRKLSWQHKLAPVLEALQSRTDS